MKKMIGLGVAIGAAIVAVGYFNQAQAAGKWTGCYGGVAAGYSIANTKASFDAPGFNIATVDGFAADGSSAAVTAGCDMQLDRFVVGLFADYSWSDVTGEISVFNGAAKLTANVDSSWAVGGRAGVLLTYDVLAYGLVGYTKTEGGGNLNAPDLDGWLVGGGIETALPMPGFYLDARYTAALYDKASVGLFGPVVLNYEPVVHTARVGLNYRFNFDGSSSLKP